MTPRLRRLSLAMLFLVCTVAAALAQRTAQPLMVNVEGRQTMLYDASYALLIGASQYQHDSWDKLTHVPKELDAVAEELTRHGFIIERLNDPKGDELLPRIRRFVAEHQGSNNRLLIYYSGHGWTDGPREVGYLVPVDAPNPEVNRPGFNMKAVSMRQLLAYVADDVRANHALFIFDSCFSGALFLSKSNALPLNQLAWEDLRLPVRQFITAGTEAQRVPGQSQFTPAFINAIAGAADLNHDGYVGGSELGFWLKDTVTKGGISTPLSGTMINLQRPGEILFSSRGTPSAPPPSVAPQPGPARVPQMDLASPQKAPPQPTAGTPLPRSVSAVPVAERQMTLPQVSNPLFRNLDIRYFRKAADGNRIVEALDKERVPYSVQRSFLAESVPTNTIACHPQIPGDVLRQLALTLFDAGVELRQIRSFVNPTQKPGRVEILAFGVGHDTAIPNPPLRREQLAALTGCPEMLLN